MLRFFALPPVRRSLGCGPRRLPARRRSLAGVPASLSGTSWVAEDIDGAACRGRPVDALLRERRAHRGSPGVTITSPPIQLSGTTLRSGAIGSTRRACPPPAMSQERLFLRALAAVTAFRPPGGPHAPAVRRDRSRGALGLTRAVERAETAGAFDCAEGPTFVLVPVLGGDVALELDATSSSHAPAHRLGARLLGWQVTGLEQGSRGVARRRRPGLPVHRSRVRSVRADAPCAVSTSGHRQRAGLGARDAPGPDRVPRPGRGT